MAKYGVTWWGQQWLNSLTRIDFSNRLPRGRAYAGNGSVKSIAIDGNRIVAKVKGSRPQPYNVTITVPVFSPSEQTILKKIIGGNPHLLSKLLNKELSPELDTLARREGISIFPTSWKDFGMSCSCPDWAVPCKHLAAVLYIVANEVDRNPFILFDLHGMDLLGAFESSGLDTISAPIPDISALLYPLDTPKTVPHSYSDIEGIDLSKLLASEVDVLAMLAPSPVFYPKDFRDLLQKTASSIAKGIRGYETPPSERMEIDPDSSVSIVFNDDLSHCAAEVVGPGSTRQVSVGMLIKMLSVVEDKELPRLPYQWVYLHKTYLYCLQLAASRLYYPRLWQSGANRFNLRYLPAAFWDEVKRISSQLASHYPDGLVVVRKAGRKPAIYSFGDADTRLSMLCSVFIGEFVRDCAESGKLPQPWYDRAMLPELMKLFTSEGAEGFDTFQTRQIPASVHQWLSVFDIHARRFIPVLRVEEHNRGFALSMLVADSSREGSESPAPLQHVFKLKRYDSSRLEIMKDLSLVGNYLPHVNMLLSSRGEEEVIVSLADFSNLLINVLPVIKLLGVQLLLPKSLRELVRPRLAIQLNKSKGAQVSVRSLVGLAELLEYDWQVALGDHHMDAAEFMRMVKGLSGLVKLKDQYIFLDESEIKALQKNLDRKTELSTSQLLQAALAEEVGGIKVGLSPDVVKLVQSLLRVKAPKLPAGLNATLRPYQQRGFEWLARNAELGMGSIIADDMGLGKTIQVICLILHHKNRGNLDKHKALVVAPPTLISNWIREIARFAPSLSTYAFHGSKRSNEFGEHDVVITSYGMIRNSLDGFEKQKWHLFVVDEAQNIKHHTTEQTKAIKKIKAEIRVAMSGTPVENRLSEYWSIFDFTNKGYLGSFNAFNEEFAKPIHFNHDMARVEQFRKVTAPFLLRRLKTDRSIIADLPDKIETNHYTSLTSKQAALYQNLVKETMSQIEGSEGIERKGLVLKLMMALKQIGNHPYQYLKQGDREIALSGKSQLLTELVGSIVESNEKVLVFTQFREMGELLGDFIAQSARVKPLFLHGGCTRKQRDEMVDKFQNGHHQVFILSLKAGGTGLNLTAANHVIHYDLWWNPAVEAQAPDRAYRIGQNRNVQVYRLINTGTIEEKIDAMIREKRDLAGLTVTTGETWLGNLSNEELKQLVRLG